MLTVKNENQAKLANVIAMVIFGTIGIFRTYIDLPSSLIAFFRGAIGILPLLLILKLSKRGLNITSIKKNALMLLLSGTAIGFNWILLFESYHYTSVAVATLCYYMAPVFVIFAAPIILKDHMTKKKLICSMIAIFGILLVSDIFHIQSSMSELKGILLGLAAAILYASVMIMNKLLHDIDPFDKTIAQLGIAAITLIPYLALTLDFGDLHFTVSGVLLLFVVAIVHTGFAYALYFASFDHLQAQTAALMSYLDPIVAILLSAFLLHQGMTAGQIVGAVLIIGSLLIESLS